MQIKIKKMVAMTLVEILAVLAIMGTITALTLPGLKKHSQKVENAKLAQHAYNLLEHAIDSEIISSGQDIDDWGTNTVVASYLLRDRLGKHLLKAKDCTSSWSAKSGCFVSYRPYKSTNEKKPSVRSFILPSGAVIAGEGRKGDVAHFYIDVNNIQPPNMEGVDVFLFNFAKYDKNCKKSDDGQWKLCPVDHAKNLIEDGWNITYW